MQNGALYQLPTLVQTISEKGFGLEPNNETFFHTPNTTGMDGGSNSRKALKKRMWLTPRVVEVDETPENFRRRMNSKRANDRKDGFGSLTMQVKWPTPMSTEHKANRQIRENHQNGLTSAVLAKEIKKWPTPRTKGMCGGTGSWDLLNKNTTVQEARQMGAGNGGQLNPTWVEWLMGWPLGWTDLNPLEMDKSLYVQQQHGNY
jgi:DNA (cytosine-5)-methyltransferase 1